MIWRRRGGCCAKQAKIIPRPDTAAPDRTPSSDRILGGRVRLVQPATGYRAAVDPVLLAAAVPAGDGDRVLDLGTGVGAAALCLAARVPGCAVTGLELQPAMMRLAAENIALNGMAGRVSVVQGDIAAPPAGLGGDYDHVMANPPYLPRERAEPSARDDPSAVETGATLADWIAVAAARARRKGTVTLIHRADRLDELLALLRAVAGDIAVMPLWPRRGAPAKRVLVRARTGVASPTRLLAGMALHETDGDYTPAAEAVLRDAARIEF